MFLLLSTVYTSLCRFQFSIVVQFKLIFSNSTHSIQWSIKQIYDVLICTHFMMSQISRHAFNFLFVCLYYLDQITTTILITPKIITKTHKHFIQFTDWFVYSLIHMTYLMLVVHILCSIFICGFIFRLDFNIKVGCFVTTSIVLNLWAHWFWCVDSVFFRCNHPFSK